MHTQASKIVDTDSYRDMVDNACPSAEGVSLSSLQYDLAVYKATRDPQDRADQIARVGLRHDADPLAFGFLRELVDDAEAGRLHHYEVWALALALPRCLPHFPADVPDLIERVARSNPEPEVFFRLGLGIRDIEKADELTNVHGAAGKAVRVLQRALNYFRAVQQDRVRHAWAGTDAFFGVVARRLAGTVPTPPAAATGARFTQAS